MNENYLIHKHSHRIMTSRVIEKNRHSNGIPLQPVRSECRRPPAATGITGERLFPFLRGGMSVRIQSFDSPGQFFQMGILTLKEFCFCRFLADFPISLKKNVQTWNSCEILITRAQKAMKIRKESRTWAGARRAFLRPAGISVRFWISNPCASVYRVLRTAFLLCLLPLRQCRRRACLSRLSPRLRTIRVESGAYLCQGASSLFWCQISRPVCSTP
jgi:hypothetical protein